MPDFVVELVAMFCIPSRHEQVTTCKLENLRAQLVKRINEIRILLFIYVCPAVHGVNNIW